MYSKLFSFPMAHILPIPDIIDLINSYNEMEKTKMAKMTFSDGSYVEGTADELREIVQNLKDGHGKFDDKRYYYSESKGQFLLIEDMATQHIRNAILKTYRKELDRIKNANLTNDEFVTEMDDLYVNEKITNLLSELENREDEEGDDE